MPTNPDPIVSILNDLTDRDCRIEGRVSSVRTMSRYIFADVQDHSGSIQVIIRRHPESADPEVKAGSLVSVAGVSTHSRTGERSIASSEFVRLRDVSDGPGNAKIYEQLHALSPGGALHENLMVKTIATSAIRAVFESEGFLEVDTGILQHEPFVGAASPLTVERRDADSDLFVRGTMELALKSLACAGWPRVFEIGPCGRNESAPLLEYSMLEAMWTHGSSLEMLTLVEQACTEVGGRVAERGLAESSCRTLGESWKRQTFTDTLSEWLGVSPWSSDRSKVISAFSKFGRDLEPNVEDWHSSVAAAGYAVLKSRADSFEGVVFVSEFPSCISPLALPLECESGSVQMADRGYAFFNGWRICEVVAENMSPEGQRAAFTRQTERGLSPLGDSMSPMLIAALEFGARPAAGLGFNFPRFLGALLGVDRYEELVFFPLGKGRLPR